MEILIGVDSLDELRQFKSLNFEPLKGDRSREYSIRLNLQYRLIFSVLMEKNGDYVIEALLINEISKHYQKWNTTQMKWLRAMYFIPAK